MKRSSLVLLIFFIPLLALAQDLQQIPNLERRVTDTTGTLFATEKDSLESQLQSFESTKGSQIGVLIVATTQPEPIEQYSIRVVESWKLGRKKVDDGVLLIVALKDRRMRIEVGYGLEGALSDIVSKRIIEEVIKPKFKEGDIPGGINAGVQAIISVISGEELPAAQSAGSFGGSFESSDDGDYFLLIVIGLGISLVFTSLLGKLGSGFVGSLAALLIGIYFFTVGAGIVAAFLILLIRLGGGGSSGFSSGGYSSGGRSSGGYSGGGGSFGGGGSSGSW